jgi:hypothetical protein
VRFGGVKRTLAVIDTSYPGTGWRAKNLLEIRKVFRDRMGRKKHLDGLGDGHRDEKLSMVWASHRGISMAWAMATEKKALDGLG